MNALMSLVSFTGNGHEKVEGAAGERGTLSKDDHFRNLFTAVVQHRKGEPSSAANGDQPDEMDAAGLPILIDESLLDKPDESLLNKQPGDELRLLLVGLAEPLISFLQSATNPLEESVNNEALTYAKKLYSAGELEGNVQTEGVQALAEFIVWLAGLPAQGKQPLMELVAQTLSKMGKDMGQLMALVQGGKTEGSDNLSHTKQINLPLEVVSDEQMAMAPQPGEPRRKGKDADFQSVQDGKQPSARPSVKGQPQDSRVVKAVGDYHRVDHSLDPPMTQIEVGTNTGHGELVTSTERGTTSAVPNPAPNTSAVKFPEMWMANPFTTSLRRTIMRHLRVEQNGTSHTRLSLYPANLGQVDVRLTSVDGVLTAHLVADTWLAKELLDSQLLQLRQALQDQGLQVNTLEVSVGEEGLMSRSSPHWYGEDESMAPREERSAPSIHVVDVYLEGATSQLESWRNPHASVNYTV